MAIYQPSELRAFLDELGISPKKGLSQNFLIDGNIVRKILMLALVEVGDNVLEIGPGPGALTQALLDAGARVLAIEKDAVLANALDRLQTPTQQLTTYCQDILTVDLEKAIGTVLQTSEKRAKVIANLPYHLTTPILAKLIPQRETFSSLTLMVQEEVARRMAAEANTKDYGSLSLFLRFYTCPTYAFSVSRYCFYPAPKVDSAVVTLKLREPPLPADQAIIFFELTRTAFSQRRKMMRTSLKNLFPSEVIEKALTAIGSSPLARPENLSLDQFLKLYRVLYIENPEI